MGTKIRLKGASVRLGMVLGLLSAGSLHADFIWQNNNTINNPGPSNDSNTNPSIGTNLQWTLFDNFTTPAAANGVSWVATTLDFTDFVAHGVASDVTKTTWSIWSGDPLKSSGTLVATGTGLPGVNESYASVGALGAGAYRFTISGLNVMLSAGTTYYFGRSNSINQDGLVSGGSTTTVGYLNAPLVGQTASWETDTGSVNGATKNFDAQLIVAPVTNSDTVFDIQGGATPEPGTWALMGIAMAGFFLIRRRRIA